MRLRIALAGAVAATALVTMNAEAAPALVLTDVAGDANGVNGQGVDPTSGDVAIGPANRAAADILQASFDKVVVKKKVTGYTVTVKLAAAPADGTFYRVRGVAGPCTVFWLQYGRYPNGEKSSSLRLTCGGPSTAVPITVTEQADGITFFVAVGSLPSGVTVGTEITGISVSTLVFAGDPASPQSLTAPQLDVVNADKGYKIGS